MCKLGDIIVVNSFIGEANAKVNKHSFVVISDKGGIISGLEYSFVASGISSFKSEKDKKRKLSYYCNMELPIDSMSPKEFRKSSYIKADKTFYFNKEKIDYYVLDTLKIEYFEKLLQLIATLDTNKHLKQITVNL